MAVYSAKFGLQFGFVLNSYPVQCGVQYMWGSKLTKAFYLYSWYPPTGIMVSLRCTEHPPMYSWYAPRCTGWVKIKYTRLMNHLHCLNLKDSTWIRQLRMFEYLLQSHVSSWGFPSTLSIDHSEFITVQCKKILSRANNEIKCFEFSSIKRALRFHLRTIIAI